MPDLETRNLIGVEILSVGGPIHGVGSPPEGDYWSADDLRAMAEADAELGDELKPPNKLGHSAAQTLLENSGLPAPTPGEMPAAGWLENVRVNDDGSKLLADIMAVPKTVADLIDAGAWRTRSVELSKITSQATGKAYDWVVTGLAWLGGKMPAVRTLDDVVALYEREDLDDHGARAVIVYAAGDVVWSPTDGMQSLRDAVDEALNGPYDAMVAGSFWVCDVQDGKALIEDWEGDNSWVVPFQGTAATGITIGSRDQWTPAEHAWLEGAKAYEARAATRTTGVPTAPSDSRPVSDEYTSEQRRKFADATGLDADKVTDEVLENAGVPVATEEPKPADEAADAARENEAQVLRTEVDALKADVELSKRELHEERRNAFIESALTTGRITPGQREKLETLYDKDSTAAREFVAELPANDDLAREYGAEGNGEDEDSADAAVAKAYEQHMAHRDGVKVEELI